jgi:hypothetical protein
MVGNLADGRLVGDEFPASGVRGKMDGVSLHHHQSHSPVSPPVQYQIIGTVLGPNTHTHTHTLE